jgi:hypothetical protein
MLEEYGEIMFVLEDGLREFSQAISTTQWRVAPIKIIPQPKDQLWAHAYPVSPIITTRQDEVHKHGSGRIARFAVGSFAYSHRQPPCCW